jgi:hypothetical protein
MTYSSLSDELLAPNPERGKLGFQYFSFFTGLRLLFSVWATDRVDGLEHMTAIPFDKLGNVGARVWSAARDIEIAELVPVPFHERHGVHGPGQAITRRRNEPARYLLDVLHDLQTILPERAPFDVKAYVDRAGEAQPTDWRTEVHQAIPGAPPETLLQLLPRVAAELLEPLAPAIQPLDQNAIRALGTHCDVQGTLEALHFHLDRLARGWARAFGDFEDDHCPNANVCRNMTVSCRELKRKTIDNEARYRAARDSIRAALPGRCLARSSFEAVYHPAEEIWADARVQTIRESVAKRTALVDVLDIITRASDAPVGDRALSELQARLEQDLAELSESHLPKTIDAYQWDKGVNHQVLQRLEVMVEEVF